MCIHRLPSGRAGVSGEGFRHQRLCPQEYRFSPILQSGDKPYTLSSLQIDSLNQEFRWVWLVLVIREKFRKGIDECDGVTSSEGASPGHMVRIQEPNDRQTSSEEVAERI